MTAFDPNPAKYTPEELDALPTDVASWDRSKFAGAYLTVRELRDLKTSHPKVSARPAYGFPRFRVGDVVQYCHAGEPRPVRRVSWCDCTGCGHYSFWRISVDGRSDQDCNFQLYSPRPEPAGSAV